MAGQHPDKDIRKAIAHAVAKGWTLHKAKGHAWGILRCPENDAACRCGEFCQISVWSTPRSPTNEARRIRRLVDGCMFAPAHQGQGRSQDQGKRAK